MIKNLVKATILIFCALVFALGTLLIIVGIHISTNFLGVSLIAFSTGLAFIVLFSRHIVTLLKNIRKRRAWRIVINAVAIGVIAALLYIAVISIMMIIAMNTSPPDEDVTLIIHGAQVVDEEPNIILHLRLRAALEFMQANPYSVAVLSGGVGNVATISEGEAMRRFLVNNGIANDRLFVEGYSTSTLENIAFSSRIIEEQDLPRNVVITTDGFHQFRAQSFARDVGLNPSALPSTTPITSLPYYWFREIAAITTQVVLG
ncbi:MAG: YdcF family protein [Oscillospiraceae bacterium]|nr:YdcF family protein [Oscillospiraceae bacterium]